MLFADISIINEDFAYLEHQWVGTQGARIAYVGGEAPEDPTAFGEIYDGAGRLLMPGFYNAHAHAPIEVVLSSRAGSRFGQRSKTPDQGEGFPPGFTSGETCA